MTAWRVIRSAYSVFNVVTAELTGDLKPSLSQMDNKNCGSSIIAAAADLIF